MKNITRVDEIISDHNGKPCFCLDTFEEGMTLEVSTKNSVYTITKENDTTFIEGTDRFPTPMKVTINGSTFGGSMLVLGRLIVGMHMELFRVVEGKSLLTTRMKEIKISGPNNDWSYVLE